MMRQNRILTLLFAFCCLISVNAQQWIDVTEQFVVNPSFDGDDRSTGWQGDGFGAAGPMENAEHYQKNYNSYQEISGLTPGKYRVSVNAFYRMGSAQDDYTWYSSGDYADRQHAKLYATSSKGDYETGIAPVSSGAVSQSLGGGVSGVGSGWMNTKYVPNNMEAAYYWFEAGYYNNTVECEVGNDGNLTIGVRKYTTLGSDWTCLDNWRLEYYGKVVNATRVDLINAPSQIFVGEQKELSASIYPDNATYKKVTWTSSNSNIAVVEGNMVTGVSAGNVTITATSYDGKARKSFVLTVKAAAEPSADNIIINEIMAANVDVYRDPSTNYGSWVELYNPTSSGVKIGGLYVTDDPANLKKNRLLDEYGTLPAKGYAILNFDHHEVWTELSYRQIDDKLDCDGGTIIISDGNNIFAQQDYPAALSRVSYARTSDGAEEWGLCGQPTPGSSNIDGKFATEQLPAPEVDKDGGLFTGSFTANVTIPAGATLRYTTDGTAPTLTNGNVSTDGRFNVNGTVCYRFRLFKDGYLPSVVVTRSYIYNNGNEPFPIISIVMNKDDWDGKNYGLFSTSIYGRPGNGQTTKYNANMDWDRPVNFEYITDQNEYVLSQECDMSTCGGWSRGWTPHSFKLKATKVYDLLNTFDYQFFDEKPFLKHKTLQIRNGGNDTGARIKDPAIQGIVASSGLNVEHQAWQPVHVFINGQSYAVLNMREPNNKHYGYANHGIDTDAMDQFEMSPDSGYVQMEGTEDAFLRWYDLSSDAEDESVYEEISKIVDIDEYINYMAVELYTGNWDWPQNNVKGYRDINDGKFRFVLFDMDGSFSTSTPFDTFFGKEWYSFDTLHGFDYSQNQSVEGTKRWLEIKFVTIFKNMLKNPKFKKQFIDTYCLVAGSVFEPGRVNEIVNEMASYLGTGGYVSPNGTANDVKNNLANRRTQLANHFQSYMDLENSSRLTVNLSSSIDAGRILVDDLDVPTGKFDGYLYLPVTVKAIAPAGYEFAGWTNDGKVVTSETSIFDKESQWKYYDAGSLDGTDWKSSNYSDASWGSGAAPLGYGKNQNTTTASNHSCYYFRKSVSVKNAASVSSYNLDWIADDGFVVYVNGKEAGRYQMNGGEPKYSDYSSTWAYNNPDAGSMSLSASLFKEGNNVIAVEVHNNSATSSDILWEASLTALTEEWSTGEIVSADEEYTLSKLNNGILNLVAVYEKMEDVDSLIAQGTTPIKINEVSAGNTMYVNDYFKKDDWIELYNTTDDEIDVAGMYLSDNEDNPQKYQIPSSVVNTVIEPHGYLIVWASKRESLTQLHAPFKLSNTDDSKVILTSSDGEWSDCLTYSTHTGMQTVGLYPDGSNEVYLMDVPTINKTNILDSYATFLSHYVPSQKDDPIADEISSVEGGEIVSTTFYTIGGVMLGADRDHLPTGTYIVKHILSDGTSITKKIFVK